MFSVYVALPMKNLSSFGRLLLAPLVKKNVQSWVWVIGSALVFTIPKVRREYLGFKGVEALPLTYPLPNRARTPPSGYEGA